MSDLKKDEADFKVGDIVYQKAPLGIYNTRMKIASIISNLAKCEWTHKGKEYQAEFLFKDLIHDKNDNIVKEKRNDVLTDMMIDHPEIFNDND